MADSTVTRLPMSNKGMVQKLDLNQLSDGQYAYLLNTVSEQEGALSPRYGYTDISITSWGPARVDSLFVSNPVTATDAYKPNVYVGESSNIRRVAVSNTPSTSPAGTSTTISTGGIGVTGSGAQARRIGITQYATDQYNNVGTTYMATGYNFNGSGGDAGRTFRGVLRDNGSYSVARTVGILPPVVPAFATPAAPQVKTFGTVSSNTRVNTTTSTAIPTPTQSVLSDYYQVQVGTVGVPTKSYLNGIQEGMYITVGTGGTTSAGQLQGPVGGIDQDNSIFYLGGHGVTPSIAAGSTVVAYTTESANVAVPAVGTALVYAYPFPNSGGTADFSLTGVYQNGYDSNDTVHVSFYNGTPSNIQSVELRIFCGSSNGYYSYMINLDSALGASGAYWLEQDIIKSAFTKNGVGSGNNSWINVTAAQLVITPVDTSVGFTINAGQLFAWGHGGLDSGSDPKLQPYDYVYTYRDPETGAESNPSPLMNADKAITVSNQGVRVTFFGTDNGTFSTNCSSNAGVTQVAIYRRGGSFTDGAFRRVGLATNPGISGTSLNNDFFIDTVDDLSITNAVQAKFDNDAPVTVSIGKEYVGSINSGTAVGNTPITITPTVSGVSDLTTVLTPGTQVIIGNGVSSSTAGGSENQEIVTVWNITATTFDCYLSYVHAANEQVSWSTNAGLAGDQVLAAMDCLWMAGVAKAPHMLWRSKTGQPEAWPTINESTGNAHVVQISTPDNPIMGLAEFNGEIVALCQHGIYTVRLDNGRMVGPFKTPANRGLVQKYAWTYVDNEIWFLSYDGIYAWAGGSVRKVSLAIDFVFNQRVVNGVTPLNQNYTGTGSSSIYPALVSLVQKGNEVYFAGNFWQPGTTTTAFYLFRYNILFDRWSVDEVYDASATLSTTRNGVTLYPTSVTCLASNKATGDIIAAKSSYTGTTVAGLIYYNNVGTYSDGTGAHAIYYDVISKCYDMGAALVKKKFTDIGVEFTSGAVTSTTPGKTTNTFVSQLYYDYSSTADSTDVFNFTPGSTGRQTVSLPLQQTGSPLTSAGKEARAVQFEFYGTSTAANFIHGLSFNTIALQDIIKGRVTDWSDLGHPYDKRLSTVTIEYDNSISGTPTACDILLDTVSGIAGGTQTLATQTLTLPAATGRSKITLPINDGTIAKMVRLRPKVASAVYEIFDFKFVQDNYPPDKVYFTDFKDEGYEYEKRLYALYINCDTNNQNVRVDVWGDGGILQTVTVTGTADNRMQAIPLNPDLIAKLIRLNANASDVNATNSKFQLFDYRFDYEKLPKPTIYSTPWSDFGYDYLKDAEQIAFDVNTNGQTVPVQVYCDGTLNQTVNVNTTHATRNINITLNPAIQFKTMRLKIDPTAIPVGGRFQLWDYTPIFVQADKGAVKHTFDWDDLGHPYDKKISEVTIEFETGHDSGDTAIQLAIDTLSGIDGNTPSLAAQTLTLPNTSGVRGKKTFPLTETVCKMIRIRSLGNSGGGTQSNSFKMWGYEFSNTVKYPQDKVYFTDYSDQGYEYEKRLYQLYINCDTAGNNVRVDIVGDNSVLQTVTVNGTAANRMQSFAMNPDLVARLIRLNTNTTDVNATGAKFQLFDYHFDYEKLPKPTVLSTEWTDFGYDYTKYAEQITFDVNTNGQTVPVQIWGDGSLKQTVNITSTQATRSVNITLNPGITFQMMRLQVDPTAIPSGGRFQLWEYKAIFRPVDKGAVYHTFDWDDLGHPYDKKISEITIEFETGHDTNDTNVQVAIDTLTGIDGNTRTLAAQTLTLPNSSGGRGQKTFPLTETVCKMVRVRSLGQNGAGTQSPDFKMWGYKFGNTIPYPADTSKFTEWTNANSACAKIFRGVGIQIDTGGVDCTVGLEVDGTQVQTWTVNTSTSTRQTFETPVNATEINGYLFRLTFTPGTGGKAQLFGQPEWNLVRDACDFVIFDTYNQGYGSVGYSIIKQLWVDYKCAGTITVSIYREDGTFFYSTVLPVHPTRETERFYVPSVYNGVKNKDKKHRIVLTANDPTKKFRLYRDCSRTCYINLSKDQRQDADSFIIWENLVVQV